MNRINSAEAVGIVKGSTGELKYHLLFSKDSGYLSDDEFNFMKRENEEISKMLN